MPMLSPITVTLGQATHPGPKQENQDCIGMMVPDQHTTTTKGISVVIADGVSSASAAKEASEVCVRTFLSDYYSTPETWSVKHSVQKVLQSLNNWLNGQNKAHGGHGYSHLSTLSVLILKSNVAHIFHIGDTRIYRIRDGAAEQITRDHCYSIEKNKSYLNRAMGMDNFVDIDYQTVDIKQGDLYFLCSDGVYEFFRVRKHFRNFECPDDFEAHCQEIIDSALANDANDNLSCQLVRIDDLLDASPEALFKEISNLRFPPELDKNMIFDGYIIEREIYASSRSQLYMARDQRDGKIYALKTPSVNFEDDAAYIEQFTLEPWLASQIDNPHVINAVHNPHRSERYIYFLMEYIEGITLAEWSAQHERPSLVECLVYIEQLVDGVRALHRKQIIHQDLKPENILIDKHNMVKIIDLGSSYVAGVREVKMPFQRANAMGTKRYSAPEIFSGEIPTEQADMFSVGCMFYEMLTHGHHPFGESYSEGKWLTAASEPLYIPASQFNPDIPQWVDAALSKAVAFRAEERYQASSEFMADVQSPNYSLHLPRTRRTVQNALDQQKRITRTLIVSNVLTLLLLIAIVFAK